MWLRWDRAGGGGIGQEEVGLRWDRAGGGVAKVG